MLLYVRARSTKLQEGSGSHRSHAVHSTVLTWFRIANRRIRVSPRPRSTTSNQEGPNTQTGGCTCARFLHGSPSGQPEAGWPW